MPKVCLNLPELANLDMVALVAQPLARIFARVQASENAPGVEQAAPAVDQQPTMQSETDASVEKAATAATAATEDKPAEETADAAAATAATEDKPAEETADAAAATAATEDKPAEDTTVSVPADDADASVAIDAVPEGDVTTASDPAAATAAAVKDLQAATTDLLTIAQDDLDKLHGQESASEAEMGVAKLVCALTGGPAGSMDDMKAWLEQEDFAKKLFKLDVAALPSDGTAALAAARGTEALEPKVAGKDSPAMGKLSAWLCALDTYTAAAAKAAPTDAPALGVPESQSCCIM